MTRLLLALAILIGTLARGEAFAADNKGTLVLYAASSTANAVNDAIAAYARSGGGAVTPVYGSTANLARQISQGAPADLFLSAHALWMDFLAKEGMLARGGRRALAGNRLVLIRPGRSGSQYSGVGAPDILGVIGDGVIALCEATAVPCGIYARQSLERLHVWDAARGRAIFAEDARTALAWVERGEAAAGIVYASDALGSGRVHVHYVFPEASHDPIHYEIALMKGARRDAANRFLLYLLSKDGRRSFAKYGFSPPPPRR